MSIDPDSRVALAEIRGDVKLVLTQMERFQIDLKAHAEADEKATNRLHGRLDEHHQRIDVLESTRDRVRGAIWLAGGGGGILGWIASHLPGVRIG